MCKKWQDWYLVSTYQVKKLGGEGLFTYHKTLCEALQTVFPQFPWQPNEFLSAQHISSKCSSYLKDQLKTVELKFAIHDVRSLFLFYFFCFLFFL
jgi:hypothetical protein